MEAESTSKSHNSRPIAATLRNVEIVGPWPPVSSARAPTQPPDAPPIPGPGAIPKPNTFTIASDLDGVVVRYPAGAARMLLWTPQEVIGKLPVGALHPSEKRETLLPRLIKAALKDGTVEERVTLVRKDGSRFEAMLTVRPRMQDGAHIGFERILRPV